MTTELRVRRPGVVTFIGVILYIQAILSAVAAVSAIVFRNNSTVLESTGQTADAILWAGIIEAAIAVLLFAVAAGVMSGNRGARLFVAIVTAIRMGFSVWLILAHHQGGYLTTGIVYLLIGAFVLWALYGHPESDEYFERA